MQVRYFIGDESIEYSFNLEKDINIAINDLCMIYFDRRNEMPLAIFLSRDLYADLMKKANTVMYQGSSVYSIVQFYTILGMVPIRLIPELVPFFIYVGDEEGYKNALIDKRFEEIILEGLDG